MSETQTPEKSWKTFLALALSALGIIYFLVQALGIGVLWLTSLLDPQTGIAENVSNSLLVWSSLLASILLVPVFLVSAYQLRGRELPAWLDTSRPGFKKFAFLVILVWPLVIFAGWFVAGRPNIAVFLLGLLNILVAGIPVLWIYTLSQRGLNAGSQIRKWRIFGFSLTVTPFIITVTEILALIVFGLVAGLWLIFRAAMNPALGRDLNNIIGQFSNIQDIELTLQLLKPYLMRPVVIFGLLAVMSGIVPLIEEILKPLALWSLAGKDLTDREGFVAGLLCGAGFALTENLLYFTSVFNAQDWIFMVIARAGTSVLHMLGSGLVGWGLARTWRSGKWAFMALMTISAVTFHGVWNALAIGAGIGPLLIYGSNPTLGQQLLLYLPLTLWLVLGGVVLALINRHLQKQQQLEKPSNLLIEEGQEEI
jgi:hypothetical protein